MADQLALANLKANDASVYISETKIPRMAAEEHLS